MTHGLNNLRLQVEVPVEGLPNLVPNPSGDSGAWGWLTPNANSVMTSKAGPALQFEQLGTGAKHFTTEFLAATAGKYFSARLDLVEITASHNIKVKFEWYDSSFVLLSSSTASGALSAVQTHFYGAHVAPVNTAWVKMRVDFYNGTGNPSLNATVSFNKAMLTYADTGTTQTVRTNLVYNPSMEYGDVGSDYPYNWYWTYADYSNPSPVEDWTTTQADTGTHSYTATNNRGAAKWIWLMPEIIPQVSAGKSYTLQARVRTTVGDVDVRGFLGWGKANGATIGTVTGDYFTATNSGWTTVSMTATAPANTAGVLVSIRFKNVPDGETIYVDSVMLEEGDEVLSYFDGDTTDTASMTYAWTGTPGTAASGLSTSTATTVAGQFDYVDSNDWQDVLGPTHEISITKGALDVGTLNASVLDSSLDPAEANSILRPGKKVRLQSKVDGVWENIFTGKVNNANATYVKPKELNSVIETHIELSASDNITALSNQSEQRGVSDIDELPYLLEGKGVPWNINGSGNQVTAAVQTSSNENASVLDQVAITRDTELGYAWVDRDNILNVWDQSNLSSTTACTFSDSAAVSYTNMITNPSFETDTVGWVANSSAGWSMARVTDSMVDSYVAESTFSGATGTNGAIMINNLGGRVPVDTSKTYTMSVYVKRMNSAGPANVRLLGLQYDASNAYLGAIGAASSIPLTVGEWTRIDGVVSGFNANTTNIGFGLYTQSAGDLSTGGIIRSDGFMITEGSTLLDYFDGATPSNANDTYSWDGTAHASTSTRVYSPLSYTDIDVDFNMDACINHVTIKWLRYANGKTEEITYGPYTDATSIATWGAKTAEFTIGGAVESSSAIATYAASILTANATPQIRCNTLVMPVRTDDERKWATMLDLYTPVTVKYDTKVDANLRITGIEHTITPEDWSVSYSFDIEDSVAAPTWTPAPTPAPLVESIQSGTVTATVTTANVWETTAVAFPAAFPAVPSVTVTFAPTSSPGNTLQVDYAVMNVTTTGFDLLVRRSNTTNAITNWIAVV